MSIQAPPAETPTAGREAPAGGRGPQGCGIGRPRYWPQGACYESYESHQYGAARLAPCRCRAGPDELLASDASPSPGRACP